MSKLTYETLSSEKYLVAAMQQQACDVKRSCNRETFRTLLWAGFGLSLLAAAVYTMPVWVMSLIELAENYGW